MHGTKKAVYGTLARHPLHEENGVQNSNRYYFQNADNESRFLNRWDAVLLVIITSFLFFLAYAGQHMAKPYQLGQEIAISLSPKALPGYALQTVLRMFIALGISLLFTFVVGTVAAKSRRAEHILVPAIDILQSVPVLSFLSISVSGFIHFFPNSMLGPECASIFAIFTAQVWNMTLGFYQSLKMLPHDIKEASDMFQLSAWQRFWKVEVPFSMSGLLWNMMVSMSASWFFVVLSEAIVVAHQDIRLPGIGSYIAVAISQGSMKAVMWAILAMMVIIFLYDQLFFRPLLAWSEKFRYTSSPEEDEAQSWLVDLIRKSPMMHWLGYQLAGFKNGFINPKPFRRKRVAVEPASPKWESYLSRVLWFGIVGGAFLWGLAYLVQFIFAHLTFKDVLHVSLLGLATATRVVILIVLSSLVWIPVGVWIGQRPKLAQRIQPVIQFVAAFPANLFYPLFVIAIVQYQLNVEIWITPLMILGTQWYILFNVIAGAQNIPRELYLVADNFGLKGWQWWRRLALPGIFPYYITGAIAAAGGAWNASIVAEWVSWGNVTLRATGLGEYIQANTLAGDFPKIALGTVVMCLYVLVFNHLVWRPLYRLAEERFQIQ